MIADLLDRYKHLVDLASDPKVFPTLDPIHELTVEWFQTREPTFAQRQFIMNKLKTELDRQTLFHAMQDKFGSQA